MPTLSEFVLTISLRYEEVEDRTLMCFRFETQRQFRSFRYQIEVEEQMVPEKREIEFSIKGVLAPSQTLSSSGPAVCEICYPELDGIWNVKIAGAKQVGEFKVKLSSEKIKLIEGMNQEFVEVQIASTKEIIRG